MFKHILIPLDGSRMAESVLPIAAYLAKGCGAKVTLIHVIERNAPAQIHGERHLTSPEEAQAYLKEVSGREFPDGLHIEYHVHTTEVGHVAQSLADHAEELGIDLIVMCAHGHKRLDQMLFGTIAQQVISYGKTPVLVMHPETATKGTAFSFARILVPLDGYPEHEQSIPVATNLAQALGASVHLLVVVQTFGTLSGAGATESRLAPGTMSAMLDIQEESANEYLLKHVTQLRTYGHQVSAEVARGEPATVIVEIAQRIGADLITMGTHGKTGTDAFWSGSVTPRAFDRSKIPLLLVPVGKSE